MQHQEVNTILECFPGSMLRTGGQSSYNFMEAGKLNKNFNIIKYTSSGNSYHSLSTQFASELTDMIHICLHENTFILYSINVNHTEIFVPEETVTETYI